MVFDVAELHVVTESNLREVVNVLRHQKDGQHRLEVVIKSVAGIDKHLLIQLVFPDELVFVLRDHQRAQLQMVLDVAVDVVEREFEKIHPVVGQNEAVLEEEFCVVKGSVVDEDLLESLHRLHRQQLVAELNFPAVHFVGIPRDEAFGVRELAFGFRLVGVVQQVQQWSQRHVGSVG